jgi:hypothetical protein
MILVKGLKGGNFNSCDCLPIDCLLRDSIHQLENNYVRGINHVNGIESFGSFAKLRMGKMCSLYKTHISVYLSKAYSVRIIIVIILIIFYLKISPIKPPYLRKTLIFYIFYIHTIHIECKTIGYTWIHQLGYASATKLLV